MPLNHNQPSFQILNSGCDCAVPPVLQILCQRFYIAFIDVLLQSAFFFIFYHFIAAKLLDGAFLNHNLHIHSLIQDLTVVFLALFRYSVKGFTSLSYKSAFSQHLSLVTPPLPPASSAVPLSPQPSFPFPNSRPGCTVPSVPKPTSPNLRAD